MDNNYTEFTALDFAQELSFIRWVRQSDGEAIIFWEQWVSENPRQAPVVEEAKRIVLAIRIQEVEPTPETLHRLWDKIDQATAVQYPEARRMVLRRLVRYAAAAAAVVLIAYFYLNSPTKVVYTENAEQLAFDLPDGSTVQVNAATELRYKPGRWKKERRIALKGEAFFQVEKGEPFIVETDFGTVEVLGTSFNVKAREGQFEVDCFTGKVRVSTQQGAVQILTPGLSTRLASDAAILETPTLSDPELTATWRTGRFYFQEATLKTVFSELSRQYGVEIQVRPDVLNRRTTTFFELGNLDSALYKVCWPMQLNANRKGNVVVVQ